VNALFVQESVVELPIHRLAASVRTEASRKFLDDGNSRETKLRIINLRLDVAVEITKAVQVAREDGGGGESGGAKRRPGARSALAKAPLSTEMSLIMAKYVADD